MVDYHTKKKNQYHPRRTDNIMATKKDKPIYKIQHRKLKIEHHESH